MSKREQKRVEKKEVDITTHKEEPYLMSHADRWYVPAVDIYEVEDEVVIEVDMPGVSEDDVDLKLQGDEIILTGHVIHDEDRDDAVLYREYDEGHFHRHFIINETIDRERISPVMSNGVLKVSLPKKEDYRPRRIEIKGG